METDLSRHWPEYTKDDTLVLRVFMKIIEMNNASRRA
jgi:hypothetical protein